MSGGPVLKKNRGDPRNRVSVSQVGGIFVHKSGDDRFVEKSTTFVRETVMQEPLPSDQDVATQQLVDELAQLVNDELHELVRTLQEADTPSLFGKTEFQVRAIALRIAAKAYQQRLEQKKTATKAPA